MGKHAVCSYSTLSKFKNVIIVCIHAVDLNELILFFPENGESIGDEVSTITESDAQLSTLPSPGNSDLDSNVDSLNTEILVRSYHRHHNSQPSQGISK